MSDKQTTQADEAGADSVSTRAGRVSRLPRPEWLSISVTDWLFRIGAGLVFGFLFAPVVVVAITSVGDSVSLSVPPAEFSTRWYTEFLGDGRWQRAALNSLLAAVGTTVVATVAGTTAALGVSNLRSRSETAVVGLAILPLLVPGVVLGSSLLVFLGEFDLQQTYVAVIAAHTLWALPLAFSVVRASLSRLDPQLREAALDLGASPTRAFIHVVAPNIRAGLLAAALIAFIVSLQEFVMTLFVSGPDTRTVPVLAWNSLRNSLDPIVSVVSTLLVGSVVAAILLVAAVIGLERLATDT